MFDFRIAYSGFAGLNFVFTRVLGCGHIGVDYSGIRCTFLRAREYLKSNIMISLYRVT